MCAMRTRIYEPLGHAVIDRTADGLCKRSPHNGQIMWV